MISMTSPIAIYFCNMPTRVLLFGGQQMKCDVNVCKQISSLRLVFSKTNCNCNIGSTFLSAFFVDLGQIFLFLWCRTCTCSTIILISSFNQSNHCSLGLLSFPLPSSLLKHVTRKRTKAHCVLFPARIKRKSHLVEKLKTLLVCKWRV